MSTVAVIDYGMGNLHSMAKALEHVSPTGMEVVVTTDREVVMAADHVVFPGQGAARDCMKEIHAQQLEPVIQEAARSKPFLGVCMGLQVLMQHSEEGGGVDCLGLYEGDVRFFGRGHLDAKTNERLKIPQMGWNRVRQERDHPLWEGIVDDSWFYFVHSYYVDPEDRQLVAGTTDYTRRYASVLAAGNVFAVQFHPEKSQHAGLQLLTNFLRWDGTTS